MDDDQTMAIEAVTKITGRAVPVPGGALEALVSGKWDAVQELVDQQSKVESVAASLPYV